MAVVADVRPANEKKWVLHLDMGERKAIGHGGLVTAVHMAYRFMAADY